VVCLRGRFSQQWLDFVAAAIDQAMARPGPHAEEYTPRGGAGRFFGDLELFHRLPAFRRFAMQSPAARIAGEAMGSTRVNFFYDQVLVKEPGTAERTPWHQDQPYWAVSGRQVCSVWLALDPVPKIAGVAASIIGTVQNLAGTASAVMSGLLYDGSIRNMTLIMGFFGVATGAVFVLRRFVGGRELAEREHVH